MAPSTSSSTTSSESDSQSMTIRPERLSHEFGRTRMDMDRRPTWRPRYSCTCILATASVLLFHKAMAFSPTSLPRSMLVHPSLLKRVTVTPPIQNQFQNSSQNPSQIQNQSATGLAIGSHRGIQCHSSSSRLYMNLNLSSDNEATKSQNQSKENSDIADNNANNNAISSTTSSSSSILEPGTQPTIIIEPNESSSEIYESAIKRTIQWVAAAALFGLSLWAFTGQQNAEEFFAGYLIEQSLSIDNLLVFLLLFDYFNVPLSSQDRVLNYGIYGAIVMRAIMIGVGSVALMKFHAILLLFASILIYSSANVLLLNNGDEEEEDEDMSQNTIVQFSKGLIDASENFDGDRFFTMEEGIKKATPLFICMIAVEISDVVFAVDSIPAVFGVTENPLIVFTSNMFAIMGLRSLYTILSKAASDLEYLEPAVAVVLGFIGIKMIAEYFGFDVPTEISLGVVATCLSGGVGLSVFSKRQSQNI